MAEIFGDLWQYNLTRIVVVDVSDDYRLMQPPMPTDFYPVLAEQWLPSYRLSERLPSHIFSPGYLYDWHETPEEKGGCWYVGVVQEELAQLEDVETYSFAHRLTSHHAP